MRVHILAFRDDSQASSYIFRSLKKLVLDAYTIPTMPNGTQQKIVERIAHTRYELGL